MKKRRLLVVAVALLAIGGALAPVATATYSSPQSQSADIDIVFRDFSDNLKYREPDGNVVDTGAQATRLGGYGDLDDDGEPEVAFADPNDNIKFVGADGTVSDTGVDETDGIGGVADFDGDGDPDIAYRDGSNTIRFVDAAGNTGTFGVQARYLGVGDAADVDNDGSPEILYTDTSDNLREVDASGSGSGLGVSSIYPPIGVGDLDGDSDIEIAYIGSANNYLKTVELSGTTETLIASSQSNHPGGMGDIDNDGDLELAIRGSIVEADGTTTSTSYSGIPGPVVDFDGDGLFVEPPSISNVQPGTTTTSAGTITLSADVADPEFSGGDEVSVELLVDGTVVNSTTITSNQTVSFAYDPVDGSQTYQFRASDLTDNNATSTQNTLTGDYAAPSITSVDPADGSQVGTYDGSVEATVNDTDFDAGDTVTVNASADGSQIGSTTIASNQTVSFSYSAVAGSNTVNWTATDSYSQTDSFSQTYTTPATLTLYNETSPSQKVQTSADITATFFGSDGETVVQRTSSDATFNFSGLPAGTEYIVTVDAEGYRERSLVINSLYDQQSFYLLSNSVEASQIVFELSDPTGEFPPGETRLYVEKPIKINGSTTYKTVAADTFGATSAYSVVLADGARYRLRIRHDGQERILGSYTPTVATTEPLRVQRIEPSADDVPQGAVYGGVENGTLAVRFRGGENDTTVAYRVTAANGTVVVPETETTGASFAHLYPVNNSTAESYNVSYDITYGDGTTRSGSFVAGGVDGIADRFNMDTQLLSLLSWFAIMSTLGLVVIVDKRLAPAAGTGMASALAIIGTVAIPAPLLGVSGVVSVLALFGRPG